MAVSTTGELAELGLHRLREEDADAFHRKRTEAFERPRRIDLAGAGALGNERFVRQAARWLAGSDVPRFATEGRAALEKGASC